MSRDPSIDGRTRRAEGRRENRRAEILRAALEVFGRKGYHQASIADILDSAGIARGTFYLYYDGKSAVFLELLDSLLVELRSSIVGVEVGPDSAPVEEQLVDTVRRVLETVVKNRLLASVIVREAVGIDAESDQRLRAFYGALHLYVRMTLAEGRRLGIVRDVDEEIAAMCVVGTFKQFVEQVAGAESDTSFDVERLAKGILDFNLRGLLAVPGTGA